MNASRKKFTKSPLGTTSPLKLEKKAEFETKANTSFLGRYSDSMVLAVIFVAIIYWVLDSILNLFFSNKFNLIAELIGPDLYDVYLRAIVLCLFILFGAHAQSIINKLKSAKQKLNESEMLWRSLIATAPDMIIAVDQKGIIRFINQNISKLPREKAIGKSMYRFLPTQYHDLARDCIESVFKTGEPERFEVRRGSDRKPKWYTIRIGALRLDRKVIAATIISSNTTEFKQAEELIRYKELFDNANEGVFLLNSEGQFIDTNDRMLESTGYNKAEILKLGITNIVETNQIPYVESMLRKVRAQKESRFELNIKTINGRILPNEINCRTVLYLGRPCFLCIARDITETKLLHNQLLKSEGLATTGQLAASIAHEINSPLQGITALLGVIRLKYKHDKGLLGQLELINNAFISIRNTVRNLIDLNRPGREKKQPMNVNQVIENTVALTRSHLKKNMVSIKLNLAAKISTINASPQQIGQVIMNLVNNAVESIINAPDFQEKLNQPTPFGGEISIDTYNREENIIISVKDNGPGISESDLEKVFDPFFTRKKNMGMGIGLSICQSIIEDHKGVLYANNVPQGGAVFTIRLPLAKAE
ncbi:MAG: PAS domain S-box protein [Desulfobacteraceae bacterium]|jgi:PAS domain S-box-containing protein|nr:PAS domain S-box protein [Desulfobacteraceae bacterium]